MWRSSFFLKAYLNEHPSCSVSSRQHPSRSFEHESREVASQLQIWSNQRLCLNWFKLCDWLASCRIIAASKSLIWTVFFGVFGNWKLIAFSFYEENEMITGFVLIFFLLLMLSLEQVIAEAHPRLGKIGFRSSTQGIVSVLLPSIRSADCCLNPRSGYSRLGECTFASTMWRYCRTDTTLSYVDPLAELTTRLIYTRCWRPLLMIQIVYELHPT